MSINLDNLSKEQIMKQFIEVCKSGTSKDCRIYIQEAKRKGISYEELCEYKRNN